MLQRWLTASTFFLALAGAATSNAADAMRCGNQLVQKGHTFARVESLCGAADEVLPTQTRHYYLESVSGPQLAGVAQSVAVDVWIYDGTSNQLSRSLRFENGVLRDIEIIDKR